MRDPNPMLAKAIADGDRLRELPIRIRAEKVEAVRSQLHSSELYDCVKDAKAKGRDFFDVKLPLLASFEEKEITIEAINGIAGFHAERSGLCRRSLKVTWSL